MLYNFINMTLYKSSDIELFKKNIDNINENIARKQLEVLEPSKEEKDKIMNIILTFIKQKKRKIYGGYALNALINDKNHKDAIYKEYETPDIDFYSPDPILDLMEICNILFDNELKHINGKEAMHTETYSIYVNYELYCDISYVPRNIYNKMPYKEIKGINYIHPNFMTIDYFRMMTDLLLSSWRIEKAFKRLYLLQKYYSLPHNESPIKIEESTGNIDFILNTIYDFLKNKRSCITIGMYAYNYYLNKSNVLKSNKENKQFKILNNPYYEIISINYKEDTLELIKLLKSKSSSNDITYEENYPFFQFTGYNVYIYHKKNLIAIIYHNNDKCLPYFNIEAEKYENNKIIKDTGTITIGTFNLTLLFYLITIMKARTNEDDNKKNLYHTLISHLIEIRNIYFEKEHKNIFDDTPFKEFVVNCIGETMMPEKKKRLLIEYRKKKK